MNVSVSLLRTLIRRLTPGLAGSLFLGFAATMFGQVPGGSPGGVAQAAALDAKPITFETVSIRLNKAPMGPGTTRFEFPAKGDGLVVRDMVLSSIVGTFYGFFQDSQIGMPAWADQECYDIEAKVGEADLAAYHGLTKEQRYRMVQAVLEERFKLRTHRSQMQAPIYLLVAAKGGAKVKQADARAGYTSGPKDSAGNFRSGTLFISGPGESTAHAAPMGMFADSLKGFAGRAVVDKTGLSGGYDFVFRWSPADADSISLFTALEEQLGLKLEPAKGEVRMLAIDHIKRSSEN